MTLPRDDNPYTDHPVEEEAREEELEYADSATAVSPDTQRADPSEGAEPEPEAQPGSESDRTRPAGHADDDRL